MTAPTKTLVETAPETYPEVQPLPLETAKPLKLSEAIRLGSMGTLQAQGTYLDHDENGEPMMCAMSTAWYALTGKAGMDAQQTPLVELLSKSYVTHPVHGGALPVTSAIIDLNDNRGWDRQKIAGWLESIGL